MNIAQEFATMARRHPDRIAIIEGDRSIDFRSLLSEVRSTAEGYSEKGLQKGDVIMVLIPVSISFYVHLVAAFYLGLKVVLVDQIKPTDRINFAFDKTHVHYIVTTPILKIASLFFLPFKLWKRTTYIRPSPSDAPLVEMKDSETALITLTSGTTGLPKAANRTHGFLRTQLFTLARELCLSERKMHISSFPVVLLCNLGYGVTSVIPRKPKFQLFNKTKKYSTDIDLISASPFYLEKYLHQINNKVNLDVIIGGATILPHFLKHISSVVPLDRILLVYGSTEAEPICTMNANEYLHNNVGEMGICVGRPHPNIELVVNKPDSETFTPMDDGHVGEIIVAGPHVLNNYFEDEAAMQETKIPNKEKIWHRTGDAGYLKNGVLYYMGRIKWMHVLRDLIIFSPTVVEKIFSEKLGINATMLRINNRMVLFIEGQVRSFPDLPYEVEKVVNISRFKRDKRHRSRIDYQYLATLGSFA